MNSTQRELLAAQVERSHRLYSLKETEQITGRLRPQLMRWILNKPPKITALFDDTERPPRYKIPATQVAEIIRTPAHATPRKIPWKALDELRAQYGQKVKSHE
jgi:hypothetical protein